MPIRTSKFGAVALAALVACQATSCARDGRSTESVGEITDAAALEPVGAASGAAATAGSRPAPQDPETVTPFPRAGDHPEREPTIAWQPNGRGFVIAMGASVTLHSYPGGAAHSFPHPGSVRAVRFSQRGNALATIDAKGVVRVWDPPTTKLITELPERVPGEFPALTFSTDGSLLAASSQDGVAAWSFRKKPTALCPEQLGTPFATASDMAFTRDGRSLVITGGGAMSRIELSICNVEHAYAETGGTFGSVVSPDARHLAAADGEGHLLSLFDSRTGRQAILAKSADCSDHLSEMRFSRDGRTLLASGSNRWFRSFDVETQRAIATYDIPDGEHVTGLLMFDDGDRLIVLRGERAELVSAGTKSVALTFDTGGATTFELSSDMNHLLGASATGAFVWSTATGKLEATVNLRSG